MRYYAREKLFSLRTIFKILDESGKEGFSVRGEILSLGKRLHVYDRAGREVALLKQRLISILPTYDIYIGGRRAAVIQKRISILKPTYSISGCNWRVKGDFLSHNYRMIDQGGHVTASIRKRWFSFGDAFELSVPDERNSLLAVCVMLVIDCVMDAEDSAALSRRSSSASVMPTDSVSGAVKNDTTHTS